LSKDKNKKNKMGIEENKEKKKSGYLGRWRESVFCL